VLPEFLWYVKVYFGIAMYNVKHMARVACDTYGEVSLLGGLVIVVEPNLGERNLGLRWRGLRGLGRAASATRATMSGHGWRGMTSRGAGKCTRGLETVVSSQR
jgi:hypothetical protein